jgi:hypothetical protein
MSKKRMAIEPTDEHTPMHIFSRSVTPLTLCLRSESTEFRDVCFNPGLGRTGQLLPQFRCAVALDPRHCAGLVVWELEGIASETLRNGLRRQHSILAGSTDLDSGFFRNPEDRPVHCSLRTQPCSGRPGTSIALRSPSKRLLPERQGLDWSSHSDPYAGAQAIKPVNRLSVLNCENTWNNFRAFEGEDWRPE